MLAADGETHMSTEATDTSLTARDIPATRRDVLLLHATLLIVLGVQLGLVGLIFLPLVIRLGREANR